MFNTSTLFSFPYAPTLLARLLLLTGLSLLATISLSAQTLPSGKELETTILRMDSIFWRAYNDCDMEKMMYFVDENIEFYHDKGGLVNSRTDLAKGLKENLCSGGNNVIERRPVAGTIRVFPIAGVGAIISGQHTFHGIKDSSDDGIAYFFHLWKYTDGDWKMTRIFSYDHAPLAANGDVQSIQLAAAELGKFAGTYAAPQTGTVTIETDENGLSLVTGNGRMPLQAKSALVFFNRQMPLEFKFTLDEAGAVTKFSVYEKGVMVEEAVRVK